MRLIDLPPFWTILIDFIAWLVIHLGVSGLALHLPDHLFEPDGFLFRCRPWERAGETWQVLFRVRSWKDRLPDGAAIIQRGFAKKHLHSMDRVYLEAFVRESRRAEWTHWSLLLFSLLFFLWNPPAVGWFMILYALVTNAPCVIAQRYNRPRFQRILAKYRKPVSF